MINKMRLGNMPLPEDAFFKICRVIFSCVTVDQIANAHRWAHSVVNAYGSSLDGKVKAILRWRIEVHAQEKQQQIHHHYSSMSHEYLLPYHRLERQFEPTSPKIILARPDAIDDAFKILHSTKVRE